MQKTEQLNNAIFELESAEKSLEVYERNRDEKADTEVLLSLIRTAIAKLNYFDEKYGFKIDAEDQFYVDEMLLFAEKKAILKGGKVNHGKKKKVKNDGRKNKRAVLKLGNRCTEMELVLDEVRWIVSHFEKPENIPRDVLIKDIKVFPDLVQTLRNQIGYLDKTFAKLSY